jgi:hypothetical protein
LPYRHAITGRIFTLDAIALASDDAERKVSMPRPEYPDDDEPENLDADMTNSRRI